MNRAVRKALKRKRERERVKQLDSNGYRVADEAMTVFYGTTTQMLAEYGTAQEAQNRGKND